MAFDNITELAILTFQILKILNDVLVNEKLDICVAISILGLCILIWIISAHRVAALQGNLTFPLNMIPKIFWAKYLGSWMIIIWNASAYGLFDRWWHLGCNATRHPLADLSNSMRHNPLPPPPASPLALVSIIISYCHNLSWEKCKIKINSDIFWQIRQKT